MATGVNVHELGRPWNQYDVLANEIRMARQRMLSLAERVCEVANDELGGTHIEAAANLYNLAESGLESMADALDNLAEGR